MSWFETWLKGSITPEQSRQIKPSEWQKIHEYKDIPTTPTSPTALLRKAAGEGVADIFAPPPPKIQTQEEIDRIRADLYAQRIYSGQSVPKTSPQALFGSSSIRVQTDEGEWVSIQTGNYNEELEKLYSQGKLTKGKQYELWTGDPSHGDKYAGEAAGVITTTGETVVSSEKIHGKEYAAQHEGTYLFGDNKVTFAPSYSVDSEGKVTIDYRETPKPTLPAYGAPVPGDTYNVYVEVGENKYLKMPASQAEDYLNVAKDFGVIAPDKEYTFITGSKKPVGTFAFESTKLVLTETGEYKYVPQEGGIPVLDIDYISTSGQEVYAPTYGVSPEAIAASIVPGEGSPYTKFVVKEGYYYGVTSEGKEVKMNVAESGVLPDPFTYLFIPYGESKQARVRVEFLEEDVKKLVAEGKLSKEQRYDIFDIGGKDVGDILPEVSATYSPSAPRIQMIDEILYGSSGLPPWLRDELWTGGGGTLLTTGGDVSYDPFYMGSGYGYAVFVPEEGTFAGGAASPDLVGKVLIYKYDFSGDRYESEKRLYEAGDFDLPEAWKGDKTLVGEVTMKYSDWISHAWKSPGESSKLVELSPGKEWGIKLFSETGQERFVGAAWVSPTELASAIKMPEDIGYKSIEVEGGYYYGVTPEGKKEKLNVAETGVLPDITSHAAGLVGTYTPPSGSPFTKYEVMGGYYYGVTGAGEKTRLNQVLPGSSPDIKYIGYDIEDWSKIPDEWKSNVGGYAAYQESMQQVIQLRYDSDKQYWQSLQQYNPLDVVKVYDKEGGTFMGTAYRGEIWAPGTFTWQAKFDTKSGTALPFASGVKTLDQMGVKAGSAPPGTVFYDPTDSKHPFKTVYAYEEDGKTKTFVYTPTDVALFGAIATGPNPFAATEKDYEARATWIESFVNVRPTTLKLEGEWMESVAKAREVSIREENLRAGLVQSQQKDIENIIAGQPWVSYQHIGLSGETPVIQGETKFAIMTEGGIGYGKIEIDKDAQSQWLVATGAPMAGGVKEFEEVIYKPSEVKQPPPTKETTPNIIESIPPTKESPGLDTGFANLKIVKILGQTGDYGPQKEQDAFTKFFTVTGASYMGAAFGGKDTQIASGGESPIHSLFVTSADTTYVNKDAITEGGFVISEKSKELLLTHVDPLGDWFWGSDYNPFKAAWEAGKAKAYELKATEAQKEQIKILEGNEELTSYFDWWEHHGAEGTAYYKDVEVINTKYFEFEQGGWTQKEHDTYLEEVETFELKWGEFKPPTLSPEAEEAYSKFQYQEGQYNLWDAQEKQFRESVGLPSEKTIEQYQPEEVFAGEFFIEKYHAAQEYQSIYESSWKGWLAEHGADFAVLEAQGGGWAWLGKAATMTMNLPVEMMVGLPAIGGGLSVIGATILDPNRSAWREFTGIWLPYGAYTTGERIREDPALFGLEMAYNYLTFETALSVGRGVTGFRFVTEATGTPYLRSKWGIAGDLIRTTKMVVEAGDVKIRALTWTDPITSLRIEFGKTPQWTIGAEMSIAETTGRTGVTAKYPTKTLWQSVSQPHVGKPGLFTQIMEGKRIFGVPDELSGVTPGTVVDVPRLSTVMRPETFVMAFPETYLKDYTAYPTESPDIRPVIIGEGVGVRAMRLASDIYEGVVSLPERAHEYIEYKVAKAQLVGVGPLSRGLTWRFATYGEPYRSPFEVPTVGKKGDAGYKIEYLETRRITPETASKYKLAMEIVLKRESPKSYETWNEMWEIEAEARKLSGEITPTSIQTADILRGADWLTPDQAIIITEIIRGTKKEPTILHGGAASSFYFDTTKGLRDVDLYVSKDVLGEMMRHGYVEEKVDFGIFQEIGVDRFDWLPREFDTEYPSGLYLGKPMEYGIVPESPIITEHGFGIESYHQFVTSTAFRSNVPIVDPITGNIVISYKPTSAKSMVDFLVRDLPDIEKRTGRQFPAIKEDIVTRILAAPKDFRTIEMYPRFKDYGTTFETYAKEQGFDLDAIQSKIDAEYARIYVGDTGFTYTHLFDTTPYYKSVPGEARIIAEFGGGIPVTLLGYKLFTLPGLKQYADVTDMFSSGKYPERAIIKEDGSVVGLEKFKPDYLIADPFRELSVEIPKTYRIGKPDIATFDPFGIQFARTTPVEGFNVFEKQYVKKLSGFGSHPEFYERIILREGYIPDKAGAVTIPALIELLKRKDVGVFPETITGKMREWTKFVPEEKALVAVEKAYAEASYGKITTAEMFQRQLIAIETSIKAAPSKPRFVHSAEEVIYYRPEMKETVRTGYADYIDAISGAMIQKAKDMGASIYGKHGLEHATKVEQHLFELREMYPKQLGKYSPEVIKAIAKYHDIANLEGVPGVEGFMKYLPHERVAAEAIISGKLDVFPEIGKLTETEKGIVAATIREGHYANTPYDLSQALRMADKMSRGTEFRFEDISKMSEFGVETISIPDYFPKGKYVPVVPMKYIAPMETTLGNVILTTFRTDPRLQGSIIGGSFGQQMQMQFSRMWGDIDLYVKNVAGAKFALYEKIFIHADVFKKYGWTQKEMYEMFDIHPIERTGSHIGRYGVKTESPIIVEGIHYMPLREQYLRKVTQIAEVRMHEGKFYTGVEPHRGKDIADYLGISRSIQHDILSGTIFQSVMAYRSMITGEPITDVASITPKIIVDAVYGRKLRLIDEGKLAVAPMLTREFMPSVGRGESLRDPFTSAIGRLEEFEFRAYEKEFKNIPLTKRWVPWPGQQFETRVWPVDEFETTVKPVSEFGDSAKIYKTDVYTGADIDALIHRSDSEKAYDVDWDDSWDDPEWEPSFREFIEGNINDIGYFIKSLSPTKKGSLERYTGARFGDINRVLRGRTDFGEYSFIDRTYIKLDIANITKLTQAPLDRAAGTTIWRGVKGQTFRDVIGTKRGSVISDNAFKSFSRDFETASHFSIASKYGEGVLLRYTIKPGDRGLYYDSWEQEIILPRDVDFKVWDISMLGKYRVYDVDIVSTKPPAPKSVVDLIKTGFGKFDPESGMLFPGEKKYIITKTTWKETALIEYKPLLPATLDTFKLPSPQKVKTIRNAVYEYATDSRVYTKLMIGGDEAKAMQLRMPDFTRELMGDIDKIYMAFEPTQTPTTLYRGLQLREARDALAKIIEGSFEEYQRGSFLSFSKRVIKAENFADVASVPDTRIDAGIYKRIILTTTLVPGDFALDRIVGPHVAEAEVILPPTLFKVKSISQVEMKFDFDVDDYVYFPSDASRADTYLVEISPVKGIGKLPVNIREVYTSVDAGIIKLPKLSEPYLSMGVFRDTNVVYPIAKYQPAKYAFAQYFGAGYFPSIYPMAKYPLFTTYPKSIYTSAKYPDAKYLSSVYTIPEYRISDYISGKYPKTTYSPGIYPKSVYSGGKYSTGIYPTGNYLDVAYTGGKYTPGKYTGGKYPTLKYIGGYPGGKYDRGYNIGKYLMGYPGGGYKGGYTPGQYGGAYSGGEYKGGYPGGEYKGGYPPGQYTPVYPPGKYTPEYPYPYIFPPPTFIIPPRKRPPPWWWWPKFKKQQYFLYKEYTPTWTPKQMATQFPMRVASSQYRKAFGEPVRMNRDMFDKFVGLPKRASRKKRRQR